MKMFQSNIYYFTNIKGVYCVYRRNVWSSIFVYGVLSLSMARLGAKYAEVGCKYMDTFGCMSMPFGCMSMARLGACMRLLGACLTVGSFA